MQPFYLPYASSRSRLFDGLDSGSSRSNSPPFATGNNLNGTLPISPRGNFDGELSSNTTSVKSNSRPRSESITTSEEGTISKKPKGRPRGSFKKKDTLF